ncbi:oxidative DNA demethylase [Globomyces sp. JEL0801]|nr:oxidative DNA demethylase [Globomyces sp. JEL0801]
MIHEELSHSDFKTRLIDNLNKTGIRDKLKSQLRSKLYSELTLKTRIPQEQTRSSNLLSNVIDSLFVQYLKSQGFEFSLAVFLPECGLAPHQDKSSKDVLIMRMLKGIHKLTDFQMVEKEVQTNLEIDDLMHIKIRDIDKSFRSKEKNYEKSQIAALEERLYSCQREIEVRSEAQLQEQISNFKQFELAKLKLEERKSYQIEMDRQKMEFERKLVEQEAKHVEQMQKEQQRLSFREKEFDRQNTLLRQQLLDENNRVVLKESKLKNEAELNSKQYEMERDQLRRRIQEAQEQLKEVGDFKERYSQKMEEAIAQ